MAAESDNIVTFIFTGERDENGNYNIPRDATHVSIHVSITVIPAWLFLRHPNIVELICHAGVKRIEKCAFWHCPRLRRVIIPGVEVLESEAFSGCEAVTEVECPKLKIIEQAAFNYCESLRNINLPSAKDVQGSAFADCVAMTEAKFGKNLESIGWDAFCNCQALERVTIPLKNGLFPTDSTFRVCGNLKRVDLVEQGVLHETIDTLLLEGWRNDMNAVIDSISYILPNARAGNLDMGRKTEAVRNWISRVLRMIIDYKAQHRLLLSEAASVLQLAALPNDIVMNNLLSRFLSYQNTRLKRRRALPKDMVMIVLSFLELPSYNFDGEEDGNIIQYIATDAAPVLDDGSLLADIASFCRGLAEGTVSFLLQQIRMYPFILSALLAFSVVACSFLSHLLILAVALMIGRDMH